ncbi:MAG: TerB family tellurite resistance protein [Candidatus Pedobacter colombiensis]|uniref:TerB family tellurite resistance protein n=1 Tax=Candidatus Pedobacter colombiensis TaxID=3121371 RepID=A0AAJ5W7A2_9SPHI|nr:TerB family tellurite resistance protein [Pedobacter sp.]WEK17862.1 MAG: TerB family tellurite resistance protein [Pedobacter sp.]
MKSIRLIIPALCLVLMVFSGNQSKAQSTEVQQLLLNVEKLSQLKNILKDMKKGYTIISGGYNAIKDISQGNFSLHSVFLDGLMIVSPEVKKYRKVVDIITYQKRIISEYESAFKQFKATNNFNALEIDYLGRVYKNLFNQSIDNLDQLVMIITSSKLRMNDEERLQAIDRIFEDTEDKLVFLRSFNSQALGLSFQREKERADLRQTLSLFP